MTRARRERGARTSPWDVSLEYLALLLLGRVFLEFVIHLFSLARDFSVGKLADALLDLGVGLVLSFLLLCLFVRLRSWRRGRAER
ncbi:hypothetical protein [Streptomyces sp. NPDC057253]|uniref:hypothetical protein n=1 Tax=Streptomyces sp. NPDC057253 TaxID=3346069 RepID=UPI003639CEA0